MAEHDDRDDGGFTVLDDEGRLFGLVNIVDVLVVLLLIAIVVAGAALLFGSGGGDGQNATRYATLDLGQQADYIASEISAEDKFEPNGLDDSITITDVYRYDSGGETAVLIRTAINGRQDNSTFKFREEVLRLGRQITIQTPDYKVNGNITEIQTSGDSLNVGQSDFVIETTVPKDVAPDIQPGDEYRRAETTLVSVEQVTEYATEASNTRRVILGVSATTREVDGTDMFGDRPVRIGSKLPVRTGDYDISGKVIRRGSLEEPGEPANRTIVLGIDNLHPSRADQIETGLAERVRETTTAEIISRTSQPAEILVESDDGNVYLRKHPRNLDLELEIDARVRELDDGTVRFRSQLLRSGQTLTFDFGTIRVEGRVVAIDE